MKYKFKHVHSIGVMMNPMGIFTVSLLVAFLGLQFLGFNHPVESYYELALALVYMLGTIYLLSLYLGYYLCGLYYQVAINRDYGPKTLASLHEFIEDKSGEIFDFKAVAHRHGELQNAKEREVLSKEQRNAIAWKESIRRLSVIFAYCLGLCALGALVFRLGVFLNSKGLLGSAGNVFGGLASIAFVCVSLWAYKERVALDLFGSSQSDAWKINNGQRPCCIRVNIEKADGTIVWNVDPSDLDWSLDVENPIVIYCNKRNL